MFACPIWWLFRFWNIGRGWRFESSQANTFDLGLTNNSDQDTNGLS